MHDKVIEIIPNKLDPRDGGKGVYTFPRSVHHYEGRDSSV